MIGVTNMTFSMKSCVSYHSEMLLNRTKPNYNSINWINFIRIVDSDHVSMIAIRQKSVKQDFFKELCRQVHGYQYYISVGILNQKRIRLSLFLFISIKDYFLSPTFLRSISYLLMHWQHRRQCMSSYDIERKKVVLNKKNKDKRIRF